MDDRAARAEALVSLTATPEWFLPGRTVANENDRPALDFELEKVVCGFFRPDRFLDYIRYFALFEQDGDALIKKIAVYHQFHGVREAVRVTLIAAQAEQGSVVREEPLRATYGDRVERGSRKAGVFWHTQGSGESISICCYAGKLLQQPEKPNPPVDGSDGIASTISTGSFTSKSARRRISSSRRPSRRSHGSRIARCWPLGNQAAQIHKPSPTLVELNMGLVDRVKSETLFQEEM